MISAARGKWRRTASVLLGAVALSVVLGLSPPGPGAQAQVPPGPGGGATPPPTVSPLQPGVPPAAALEPESEGVGVGAPVPLRITTDDDDGRRRPPLWVGAVVGASGVLGLALSAALHRRRAATAGPDERDLAQAV